MVRLQMTMVEYSSCIYGYCFTYVSAAIVWSGVAKMDK